jgi:hypothetical protein
MALAQDGGFGRAEPYCLRVRPVAAVNGQSGPGWESESSQGPAGYGPAGRSELGMWVTGQRAGTGLGVRDSEAELGGADMSRRGKVR